MKFPHAYFIFVKGRRQFLSVGCVWGANIYGQRYSFAKLKYRYNFAKLKKISPSSKIISPGGKTGFRQIILKISKIQQENTTWRNFANI